MKMIFLLKLRDIPASYVSLPGGNPLKFNYKVPQISHTPSFANRLYHHFPTGCPPRTLLQKSPGEKRNATEIMHAYVGSGLEVLADKGAFFLVVFGVC